MTEMERGVGGGRENPWEILGNSGWGGLGEDRVRLAVAAAVGKSFVSPCWQCLNGPAMAIGVWGLDWV